MDVDSASGRPELPGDVVADLSARSRGRFGDWLRDTNHSPRVIALVRNARRALPGDPEFGDPLSAAGEGGARAAARAADRLLRDREAATREVSLATLQVWQAITERVSGRPANPEVTLVFTDLVAFSDWSLAAGDEATLRLLRKVAQLGEPPILDSGGRIVKRMGDGMMAVFDDPSTAIRATMAARKAVEAIDMDGYAPRVRAGIHTGRPQRIGSDWLGVDVNIAARVMERATRGGLIVSDRTLSKVSADDLESFGVTVNGKNVEAFSGASALPGTGSGTGLEPAAATSAPLEINGRRFSLAVTNLPQGANTVKVWAKDPAGNVSSQTTRIVVDSSEDFGTTDIRRGARGADITTLNQRLKDVHLLRGKVTSRFGPATEAAVLKYQKLHRLPRTGVVDQRTRNAMVGRIVVNLSQFTLRLIRDGRVVDKFKIAVGQPAYPTPTGNYQVVNMQMNPTWMPPNSPWAKGLGPIPPGPGNPLGTRWIGTSAPAVGIHGTYADSSIGTRASHGCMRMHIPDVEALYKDVVVGMPVIIKA